MPFVWSTSMLGSAKLAALVWASTASGCVIQENPPEAEATRGPAATGLMKRYGRFEAVRGIDFTAEERTCFGFLGPNGAGKTTTMRMISCMSPPSGGTLEVLGLPVVRHARGIKGRMGVVPQENNLD